MIEYAALAGNAAQRYIMIVSQLYAKGSLALCQRAFQSVKERQFSLCESWRFSRIKEEIGQKNKEIRAAPLPEGQFFEIHSSIFKPHPC